MHWLGGIYKTQCLLIISVQIKWIIIRKGSLCRNSDINWQNQKLHFGKNYIIIRLEYAYKVAIRYGVNNEEETKKKEYLWEKAKFPVIFLLQNGDVFLFSRSYERGFIDITWQYNLLFEKIKPFNCGSWSIKPSGSWSRCEFVI